MNSIWDQNPDSPGRSDYEASVVRLLLRKIGHSAKVAELEREMRDLTGSCRLSLEWFHDEYPRFPIRLGAVRADYVHNVRIEDLVKRFTKTSPYLEYVKFVENQLGELVGQSTVGVIFVWPGATTMILHNYPREEEVVDKTRNGLRIVRLFGRSDPPMVMNLEPLDDLLAALGDGWQ